MERKTRVCQIKARINKNLKPLVMFDPGSKLVGQFSPFFSGYLVVPGAGIDDDDDVKEEPEGGATGCVEHAAAAGWGSCFI